MAKTTMSTVDKALALLRHFSVQTPELGLSELARVAGYDKTTTLRCMTALERNGFVEQDVSSRKYRLGLTPLNLAQIREQSFPLQSVLQRYLDDLSLTFQETSHATLLNGTELVTVGLSEPERALRVHLDPSEILPVHATASGIAIAAFLDDASRAAVMRRTSFESFTDTTPRDADGFFDLLHQCRHTGVARAGETFERDVAGTAAPFFGPAAQPVGAIAVAAVSLRLTPDLQTEIDNALRNASRQITLELRGTMPAEYARYEETVS